MDVLIEKHLSAGDAQNVEELDFQGAQVAYIPPRVSGILQRFVCLQYLSLQGLGLTTLTNFPALPALVGLNLKYNKLRNSLEYLESAENLESLWLDFNKFSSAQSLEPVRKLKKLITLSFKGNPVENLEQSLTFASEYQQDSEIKPTLYRKGSEVIINEPERELNDDDTMHLKGSQSGTSKDQSEQATLVRKCLTMFHKCKDIIQLKALQNLNIEDIIPQIQIEPDDLDKFQQKAQSTIARQMKQQGKINKKFAKEYIHTILYMLKLIGNTNMQKQGHEILKLLPVFFNKLKITEKQVGAIRLLEQVLQLFPEFIDSFILQLKLSTVDSLIDSYQHLPPTSFYKQLLMRAQLQNENTVEIIAYSQKIAELSAQEPLYPCFLKLLYSTEFIQENLEAELERNNQLRAMNTESMLNLAYKTQQIDDLNQEINTLNQELIQAKKPAQPDIKKDELIVNLFKVISEYKDIYIDLDNQASNSSDNSENYTKYPKLLKQLITTTLQEKDDEIKKLKAENAKLKQSSQTPTLFSSSYSSIQTATKSELGQMYNYSSQRLKESIGSPLCPRCGPGTIPHYRGKVRGGWNWSCGSCGKCYR